jgi:hypothetical protein
MMNIMIGGSFAMFMLLIYRSMHGKTGGSSSTKTTKGSSGSFGGGGLNDLMGMSKATT